MAMNGQRGRSSSSSSAGSALSERSPLLRAIDSTGSFEGSYMALPAGGGEDRASDASGFGGGQFQPIVFADKALGALLNGVLLYALCCVAGVALASLNFEGLLSPRGDGGRVNWWLVFSPFWLANVAAVAAHVVSIRHAKQLRRWADVEAMSNEPLLPLLRRIVLIYAASAPLALLLLWSQLAFCARLEHFGGTSLYVCYAPLMVIQVAFVVRYLLCRSDSTLPGLCWVLAFAFTLLLAYQTDSPRGHWLKDSPTVYPLPWWVVASPLLALELLLGGGLLVVLYNEFSGVYRLARWQLAASALYALAFVAGVTGEVLLLVDDRMEEERFKELRWGARTFPSALVFFGLLCASVAIYIVGRYYVAQLMATKGGAMPVPLTRTSDGWITSHAVIEQWVLFGDVYLTPVGLERRNRSLQQQRRNSAVDSDNGMAGGASHSAGSRIANWFQRICGRVSHRDDESAALGDRDPERRLRNMVVRRKTSGSYSDLTLEVVDTPKER